MYFDLIYHPQAYNSPQVYPTTLLPYPLCSPPLSKQLFFNIGLYWSVLGLPGTTCTLRIYHAPCLRLKFLVNSPLYAGIWWLEFTVPIHAVITTTSLHDQKMTCCVWGFPCHPLTVLLKVHLCLLLKASECCLGNSIAFKELNDTDKSWVLSDSQVLGMIKLHNIWIYLINLKP